MKQLAIAILVLFLVSLVLGSAGAQPADETTRSRDRGHTAETSRDPGRPASTKTTEPRRAGGFNESAGAFEGRYVAFRLDLASCSILEYAVYGQVFFDQIRLDAKDCRIAKGGTKARVELETKTTAIRIHDAPNGLLRAELDDNATIAFRVNSAITAQETEAYLALASGNLSARLFTARNANDSALQWASPTLTVRGTDVDVIFHPAAGNTAERRAILDAISKGKVGAQIDILLGEGGPQGEVLSFDQVDVRVQQPGKDRFDFTVSANLSEGRVFITNFDPMAWDPQRLRVDYADVGPDGGRKPVKIRAADSLDDVLNFTSGGDPLYFIFEDAEGRHVAVAVPEFSVHAFQVVGIPLQVVPLLLYGVVIVGLFFATGGVGVALERRARQQRGSR